MPGHLNDLKLIIHNQQPQQHTFLQRKPLDRVVQDRDFLD